MPQRKGQNVLYEAREDRGINFIEKQERGLRRGKQAGERGKRVHREVRRRGSRDGGGVDRGAMNGERVETESQMGSEWFTKTIESGKMGRRSMTKGRGG